MVECAPIKAPIFCIFLTLILFGCDKLTQRPKEQPRYRGTLTAIPAQQLAGRFVFPPQSSQFPDASVALDTYTGRLCKTYVWEDKVGLPKGLQLCSEWPGQPSSLIGAAKAYLGFSYTFNGTKWVKGNKASKSNPKTGETEPWSDDQYDPLNLLSKEEKAKRVLTVEEIQRVADQFGVTYEEASAEANPQGYQVPSKR